MGRNSKLHRAKRAQHQEKEGKMTVNIIVTVLIVLAIVFIAYWIITQ